MSQQQSNENNAAKLIGLPLDRVDARLKVTGGTPYSAEYQIPNLAYGMLVESTITAGKIRAIDTTAAERAPGVIAVITHLNAERLARPVHQPSGESLPVLQEPNIFYAGQHVACVVAETLEQAEYATALVRVTYDVAPYAVDMKDRLNQAMMPELRFGSSGPRVQSKRGDFARGLNSAAVRVEETYSTPVEHHNPMEPHATIAMWEGDNLIVYDANQGVSGARQALAFNFGISQDNVRVISKYLGGGFGCKGQSWGHTTIAALAARHVKRPVKVVLRRQQMFSSNGHRSPTMQELRLGADADGRLTAMSHTSTVHTSMMDEFIEPSGMITEMMYSCPNVDVAHRLVRVNVPTPTFTRAPGESSGSFALESAMDELAYKLKLDPIELRERNYAEKDEGSGHPFSSKSLREAYKLGAERFGWKQRNPQPRSMREGRWLIGYGFASASYPANFRPAAAKATMFADGTVLAQSGTQDVGGGMYTIATQIVADTLGLPMNRVRFELGDTRFPEAPVAGGSCSAASTGSAVLLAAKALRTRVLEMALRDERSPLSGLTEKDLAVEQGRVFARNNPPRGETYEQIFKRMNQRLVEVRAGTQPGRERGSEAGSGQQQQRGNEQNRAAQASASQDGVYSFHSFGAQFCEVRVDESLGIVRIARFLGAYGAGRILNMKTAISQMQSGITWGISMALHEATLLDKAHGYFVNADLAEYHVPVNLDIPNIEVHFIEEKDEIVDPVGAKGIGEIGIVGVAAAVANAVYHATGKRVRDLPITIDKLL